MNKTIFFFILLLLGACTNANKPLNTAEKNQIIVEAKELMGTIYLACEKCDPQKLTATFVNSPEFGSFINGEFADYEETVKKYPTLMSDFKIQKPTVIREKFIALDASTVLYTSLSTWTCQMKNDSTAVYDNCKLQLLLKKSDNQWKVLNWSEVY